MKKPFSVIVVIFTALLLSETLFEVKDSSNNKVLDISTDGLRVMNGGDTLMVISTDGIRAYIQNDATKGLSRSFSVTTSASKGEKSQKKVFEIATDEGATFFNPSDNTDEIFSIRKTGITANVNPSLNRDFEVNDQISAGKVGSGNLMKVSNKSTFEVVNDSTMLWYKQKNAFRIGYVLIQDPNHVGQGSFASGYKSQAGGMFSTALGYWAQASGNNSFASGTTSWATGDNSCAMGKNAHAQGVNSFAVGNGTEALNSCSFAAGFESISGGSNSSAIGYKATASGSPSFALGNTVSATADNAFAIGVGCTASGGGSIAIGSLFTDASGNLSTAIGFAAKAEGWYSTAIGQNVKATGNLSTAMNISTTSQAYNSFVIGRYNNLVGNQTNWITTDPLFVVGNGSADDSRSNAFEVKKNGNAIVSGTLSVEGDVYVKGDEAIWSDGNYFRWGSGGNANYFPDNIGLGIVSPLRKLHIIETSSVPAALIQNTGGFDSYFAIQAGNSSNINRWDILAGTDGSFRILDKNANLSRFRIYSDGSVYLPSVYSTTGSAGKYLKIDSTGKLYASDAKGSDDFSESGELEMIRNENKALKLEIDEIKKQLEEIRNLIGRN